MGLLAALLVLAACGSEVDDPVADDPTTTTSPSTSTTTEAASPPPWLVAVTTDNRLVVVDTATGEELRKLVRFPAAVPDEPAIGLDGIDVSPDRAWVWFGVCCEPANGSVGRVRVTGGREEGGVSGYDPTFGADDRYLATAEIDGLAIHDLEGDGDRHWRWDEHGGNYQDVALSLDGRRVVVRVGTPGPGALLWLPVDDVPPVADTSEGPAPRQVAGTGWTDPTFRADGRLVVAEHAGGTSVGRVLDLETDELLMAESIDYGGELLDQDHDPTGTWLIATVAGAGEREGRIRWWGPGGATGEVPGRFYAAAW